MPPLQKEVTLTTLQRRTWLPLLNRSSAWDSHMIGVACSKATTRIITSGTNCFLLDFSSLGLHIVNLLPSIGANPVQRFSQMNKSRLDAVGDAMGLVRQKDMSQWFIDIPKYAQQLLDGLDTIEFPESVRLMQEDWLGRSEGAEIEFGIDGSDEVIRVFTTRPDTLFGVTFVTLAPEHPLAEKLVKGNTI